MLEPLPKFLEEGSKHFVTRREDPFVLEMPRERVQYLPPWPSIPHVGIPMRPIPTGVLECPKAIGGLPWFGDRRHVCQDRNKCRSRCSRRA